jgi:dihydroneopterin aldolase
VETEQFDLLERLSGAIIERVLARHPLVNAITIVAKKPQVALPGVLDYTAVEISGRREVG